MSNFSDLFLSSTALTAARDVQWMYFDTSTTFTPSQDMEVNIHVLGSGGSGGVGMGSSGGQSATGPGAGGYAIKRATLKAGITYTITIGAGGASNSIAADGRQNGSDGSPTSFVGGSLNIVANGGKGGVCTASNVAALGGAGGTATGGDKNYTGGRGGNITANATLINSLYRASGGGAWNLFGTGDCNGGDITYASHASGALLASGGGSCTQSCPPHTTAAGITYGGDLSLLSGNTWGVVTLKNRSLFGLYDTIGPSSNSSPGNFSSSPGQRTSTTPTYAGSFGGAGGAGNNGNYASSSGGDKGTPGGAVGSSGPVVSQSPRQGWVVMEILG